VKILATSDWHVDALTDGVPRWEETEAIINHTVDVAIAEHVELYLMLGDLCDPDGWNSVRAIAKTLEVAGRLADADIASVWVAGNHDVVEDGNGTTMLSPLAASQLATHVFEQPAEICICPNGNIPLRLVGLPFTPSSHAYDPVKVVRSFGREKRNEHTIVLGHLNLEGISAGSETKEMVRGREVFWPLDVIAKRWPNATLLGGHYHRAQEFKGVHVIGSLARLKHNEEDSEPSMLFLEV